MKITARNPDGSKGYEYCVKFSTDELIFMVALFEAASPKDQNDTAQDILGVIERLTK